MGRKGQGETAGIQGADGVTAHNGQQLLATRGSHHTEPPPYIVLTARDALQSKVNSLNAGADDYVLKPVDIDELEARIRAILRRAGCNNTTLVQGNLVFEPQSRHAMVNGGVLTLTRRETMLLEEMLRSTPRILVKDHLEDRIYSHYENVTLNAIEVLVSRLRRKLKAAGATACIETIRGIGYRLVPKEPHVQS
jgi:DNA-binding response OmpR family regulator|tara:strand:- start:87358 stop:87939 length:582 start_codon:yes stop_codon:yes gene_type:complete